MNAMEFDFPGMRPEPRLIPAGTRIHLHAENEDGFTFGRWHASTLVDCDFGLLREEHESDDVEYPADEFVHWLVATGKIELVQVEDVPLRIEMMTPGDAQF